MRAGELRKCRKRCSRPDQTLHKSPGGGCAGGVTRRFGLRSNLLDKSPIVPLLSAPRFLTVPWRDSA